MIKVVGGNRRSSRKRKRAKRFTPKSQLRHRGTGTRILKKEGKQCSNNNLLADNLLTERDIRSAANQRAAPLIAKINEQHLEV